MFSIIRTVRKLLAGDRRAVTALEYGLIAAVVGGVVITAAGNNAFYISNTFAVPSKINNFAHFLLSLFSVQSFFR